MSVKKFIISTSAKWFDIFALIILNIISVPLIITKWSIETYGAWIVLIGVISYINIPYTGLHQYIYSKNLQLGKKKKKRDFKKYNIKFAVYIINFTGNSFAISD